MNKEHLLNLTINNGLGMGYSWKKFITDATHSPDLGIEAFYKFINRNKEFDCYKIVYYGRRKITKKIPSELNNYIDNLLN